MALSEIGFGADSIVFKSNAHIPQAVKEYNGRISFQRALEYQMITRAAVGDLNRNPYASQIELNGSIFPIDLSIQPINRVSGMDGNVKSFADFVPGPTVTDFVELKDTERIQNRLAQIQDPREANFLRGLIGKLQTGEATLDLKDEWQKLRGFFREMSTRLGVEGLVLSTENIKVRFDPEKERFNFVVTDLCSGLLRLGVKKLV